MLTNPSLNTRYDLLFVFVLLTFTGTTSLNPILPELIVKTNAETTTNMLTYGMVVAAFPVGQLISAYFLSFLAKKQNYRSIMIATSLGSILTTGLASFALLKSQLLAFTLLRFLSGTLEGNVVLSREIIVTTNPDQQNRNKQLGLISLAITSGFLVGPILNGYLFTMNHYAGLFFPCGVACLMTLVAFKLPAYSKNAVVNQTLNQTQTAPLTKKFSPSWQVWLSCLAVYFATDLFYQYIPLFLAIKCELGVKAIAINLFLIALCNALTAPNAYLPKKWFSYKIIIMVSALAFTLNIFLLTIVNNNWVSFILCLQGMIIAMLSNNLIFYLTDRNERAKQENKSQYLMSHIVSSRVIVIAASGFTAGLVAQNSLMLPLYLAIVSIILFIFSFQLL